MNMSQEIERQKEEIASLLENFPKGFSRGQISEIVNDKTLQRRLAALIADGKVTRTGEKKVLDIIRYPSEKRQI